MLCFYHWPPESAKFLICTLQGESLKLVNQSLPHVMKNNISRFFSTRSLWCLIDGAGLIFGTTWMSVGHRESSITYNNDFYNKSQYLVFLPGSLVFHLIFSRFLFLRYCYCMCVVTTLRNCITIRPTLFMSMANLN